MSIVGDTLKLLADSTYRAMITTSSIVVFWFFAAWSMGFFPAAGQGFARAEVVESIQAAMLENTIIEARIRYCYAPNGTPTKLFFQKTVNEKVNAYRILTGVTYPLPRCEELVVASR